MGGGGGGPRSIGDIKSLVERAKKEIREGERQGRRNVFISFTYEDIDEVNLLRGQAKNENIPIEFNDWSVSVPINSERAPYIKQKILERILQSSLTVVYLSSKTYESKWVSWEIEQSIKNGKHVIGVFSGMTPPPVVPSAIIRNKIKCVPWSKLSSTIEQLD